jgi:hypothetical protein
MCQCHPKKNSNGKKKSVIFPIKIIYSAPLCFIEYICLFASSLGILTIQERSYCVITRVLGLATEPTDAHHLVDQVRFSSFLL